MINLLFVEYVLFAESSWRKANEIIVIYLVVPVYAKCSQNVCLFRVMPSGHAEVFRRFLISSYGKVLSKSRETVIMVMRTFRPELTLFVLWKCRERCYGTYTWKCRERCYGTYTSFYIGAKYVPRRTYNFYAGARYVQRRTHYVQVRFWRSFVEFHHDVTVTVLINTHSSRTPLEN